MKAIITGASNGIGKDMAELLSSRGYEVVLVARSEDKLKQLQNSLPTPAEVVVADLSRPESCFALYERYQNEPIDLLVNNAGYGIFGRFDETELSDELNMLDLNIKAVHILTKLFVKKMEEQNHGFILNVASSAAFFVGPLLSSYYASKAYVLRLTQAVQAEVNKSNKKVHLINLLKRPRFVFSAVGWGLSFIGIMGLSLAIIPIMKSKGISADMAVTIASFAGLFQLAGSLVSGFLDTRVGQRFVITLFLCLEVLGLVIFGFAPAGMIGLMIAGYYIVMFMMGAPNNLQPSMYLSMAGGGGRTFMIFNSLQTAIAATLRSFSSSILAFSTEHANGSYSIAMIIFLSGSIASVLLLNICGFKKMELSKSKA